MNEPKDSTVQPYPETLMLFDRQDDDAIIARLEGQVVDDYVYSFTQANGTVYGIGICGAEACKRELALTGEVIEEDDISLESETADEARARAKASRWAVRADGHRVRLDSAIGQKRQPKFITKKNGYEEANPHWYEQSGSKAMRNAILKLTPREIQLRVIQKYKNTKHEKKLTMPPEVNAAMGHEAHKALNKGAEHADLVQKLWGRWDEMELQPAGRKKILEKHRLPPELAVKTSDWSSVDLAVIRDMLRDADTLL